MPTQQQRSDATRELLLKAFSDIAIKDGLSAATTQAVLARTGLSKGALYHHFASKTEMAEAVYREASHGAINRAIESVDPSLPAIERLKAGCHAWLLEVRKPTVRRIVLEIGPAALGLERVLEIENALSLRLFENLLRDANDAGTVTITNPRLTARLINAYVGEVAVQRRGDRKDAIATVSPVIDAIIETQP